MANGVYQFGNSAGFVLTDKPAPSFASQPGAKSEIAKRKKKEAAQAAKDAAPTTTSTSVSSPAGKTAAEKAADRKAAAEKRKAAAAKRAEERRAAAEAAKNPLTAPFKTPAELRRDAAELAAMGVGSEDTLRATAAQQQAGLGGLTSALTGTLTGIADRTQAGLAGFGNLYSQLAGQAQSAGQSAAAAAGAPTTIAAGASPTVASNLANLSAPTMGYAPAAAVTGAQMVGAVTANLTKALMNRSSKLSADTAKYLYQLKNDEIQRAISQGTLAQNQARLGLSAEQEAWNQKVDAARLQQSQQGLNLRAQSLQRQINNDALRYGIGTPKGISAAQKSLLEKAQQLVKPGKTATGLFEYQIQVPAMDSLGNTTYKTQTITAANQGAADEMAKNAGAQGAQLVGESFSYSAPSRAEATAKFVSILVSQGMSKAAARKWVASRADALGLSSLS